MNKLNSKNTLIVCTLIMIILIAIIGPMDMFNHGFYYDEIDRDQILPKDFQDSISLENTYEMTFCPQKPHLAGFEIYLTNQPSGNTGTLHLSIESNGKVLDRIDIDLSKVHEASWYKVYTSANLKKGQEYTLRFSAEDCATIPHFQNVDSFYLPKETVTGNILLVYAYAHPTFSFREKTIISLFIIAVWGFICSTFIGGKRKKLIRLVAIGVFLTGVLTWNYMYNSMDNQNSGFSGFQSDSENLVISALYAKKDGVYYTNDYEKKYGLGFYYNLKGLSTSYITDNNWLDGYSRTKGVLAVNSNAYSREVAVVGNYIEFSNGELFEITDIRDDGTYINIYLNTDSILTPAKFGSLDKAVFYNQSGQALKMGRFRAYTSQYGLQGKVFWYLCRCLNMEKHQIPENLHFLCSFVTAVVFVLIVILISVKYNTIMAGVFFITFWLSPWVVNFARNLYWVEFTWFIPMAIGLFCVLKIENRTCRVISYIATFISIFAKSLCGYEYISTIMMGLIAFMFTDFVLAIINNDKAKAVLLGRTVFIIGLVAVAGFMAAICIHAQLRGDGSIIQGIRNIIKQDVLRRTSGADLNNLSAVYWPSLNASVWETFCKYFHFNTEVITGVTGNLFPLLCIVPPCILWYDFRCKKANMELWIMYIIFFLTTISWFCLAKGHSYIHTHMNYVLWYFGFVQICIYIIVRKFVELFNVNCYKNKENK